MSSWDRASSAFDSFGSMLNDWHGATRGALGETNFDIYGNIQHNNRMKNDELYRNAFNELNKPKPGMSNAEFAQNQLDYYKGLWEGRQRQVWDEYGQADALTAEDIFNKNFIESSPEPMGVGPLDDF